LLVLLALSLMSWAVVVEKVRAFAAIRAGHVKFWQQCDSWLDGNLKRSELVEWCDEHQDLPLANLILETQDLDSVPNIRRASERVTYLELENLERYLILLSTAVTISPFLGLLGTVWGRLTSTPP